MAVASLKHFDAGSIYQLKNCPNAHPDVMRQALQTKASSSSSPVVPSVLIVQSVMMMTTASFLLLTSDRSSYWSVSKCPNALLVHFCAMACCCSQAVDAHRLIQRKAFIYGIIIAIIYYSTIFWQGYELRTFPVCPWGGRQSMPPSPSLRTMFAGEQPQN
jgi:hypothetical protein